jgi:hypothetical protein
VKRRVLRWIGVGIGLVLGVAIAASVAPESELAVLLSILFGLWAAATAVVLLWLFWRWATYRVSVRLALSYVLIGITPFVFCTLLAGFASYLLMGQYTSVRLGTEMESVVRGLDRECELILETYRQSGIEEGHVCRVMAPRCCPNSIGSSKTPLGSFGRAMPRSCWARSAIDTRATWSPR